MYMIRKIRGNKRFGVLLVIVVTLILLSCHSDSNRIGTQQVAVTVPDSFIVIDTSKIPDDKFGEQVRYGRQLLLNTAYYIGPEGIKGKYLGNKMNCTNCHQDAGTKPYSFNLISSHTSYPQYRSREGKVLTLAERINNCVMRPHNGQPLPLDGEEMVAMLSYFKWISSFAAGKRSFRGEKNLDIAFPSTAADPARGSILFTQHCVRCHGGDGQGKWNADKKAYAYPPLWGTVAYQSGSSMHRVIKQAQWLKGNMPYDKTSPGKPFLTDAEALDIAAFVNCDSLHERPNPKNVDYPHIEEKAIDYDKGPFADSFPASQHKYGPYQTVIDLWKRKGMKPVY